MRLKLIDAHCHLNTTSKAKMIKALEDGAAFVSINTETPFFQPLDYQESITMELKCMFPDLIRHIGSFDSVGFGEAGWQARTIDQIKWRMDNGASGIKIWKNFGMEIQNADGGFVMADDERLDPIYDFLASENILMIGHNGEPKNCWLPLDEMTVDSDRDYFSRHPEYHMFRNPHFPSYEAQINARDRVLEKHPKLVFVGAHLGSLEWNLDELAERLDKFPYFHTDLAERICHVQLQSLQDREKVRNFFIRYQDRIMYGSDVIDKDKKDELAIAEKFGALWDFHWAYFTTDNTMSAPEFQGTFTGLDLPMEVAQKIFVDNARKMYGFK